MPGRTSELRAEVSCTDPEPGLATRQVAAVLAVGRAMVATLDYERVLSDVIETVCRTVAATTGGFMRYLGETDELVLQKPAFGRHARSVVETYRVALSAGGNAARVFLSREPYVTNDAAGDPRMIQRFVQLFEARNVISVPLVLGEQPIGVFHAINKQAGEFTPDDLAVLLLVAPLLASVLQTAQVMKEVEHERHKQARIMHVHRALTRTVTESQGMEPLCRTLSELLKRPVMVCDAHSQPLAASGWLSLPAQALGELTRMLSPARSFQSVRVGASDTDGTGFGAAAILLGDEVAGYILIAEDGLALDPIDRKAAEQAATVFAVELLKERSAFEAERRVAGDLLAELFAEVPSNREPMLLLRELGFAPRGPWCVVRLVPATEANTAAAQLPDAQLRRMLSERFQRLGLRLPLLPWREGFVTLLTPEAATQIDTLAQSLAAEGPLGVRIGVGRATSQASDLVWSLKGAEQALRAAQRLGITGRAVRFEELGVLRLLLSANAQDDHAEFVTQVLGELYAADQGTRGPVLVPTLELLVAHDFNLAAVARAAGVHLNTVKYRLKRIADILGGDPARGERRLELELALRLVQMKRPAPLSADSVPGTRGRAGRRRRG